MRSPRASASAASRATPRRRPSAASPAARCPLPGIGLDIDAPDDLAELVRRTHGLARYAFLDRARLLVCGSGAMSATADIAAALAAAASGRALSRERGAGARALRRPSPPHGAWPRSCALAGHGRNVSFSKKVFIPLTRLCRDVCHYCTFARAPNTREPHFLSPDAVLEIARAGQAAGCKEALFTLGDQPELRYAAAREALAALGFDSTLAYLESCAALVLRETGLLPHLNPGVMDEAWLARLRKVSVSQGIMLETASERLSRARRPAFRLARQGAGGAPRHARRRPAARACPSPPAS